MTKNVFLLLAFAALPFPTKAQGTGTLSREESSCRSHIAVAWTEAEQAAARTDCAFYAESQVTGAEAWAKYADENVATPFARGRETIRKNMAAAYARPSFALAWYPETSAEHGSFVVTTGRSQRTAQGPDGKITVTSGHYLTVWKKQPDGKYVFVYDAGE